MLNFSDLLLVVISGGKYGVGYHQVAQMAAASVKYIK